MATAQQREALLAIPCGYCGAAPGEVCTLRLTRKLDAEGGQRAQRPRPITVLDGGAHDARWQKALGVTAPVITGAVLAAQGKDGLSPAPVRVQEGSTQLLERPTEASLERPW